MDSEGVGDSEPVTSLEGDTVLEIGTVNEEDSVCDNEYDPESVLVGVTSDEADLDSESETDALESCVLVSDVDRETEREMLTSCDTECDSGLDSEDVIS